MAQELVFTRSERNLLDLAAQGDGEAVALWSGLDHQQQQGLLVRAEPEQRRDLLFLCDDATAHARACRPWRCGDDPRGAGSRCGGLVGLRLRRAIRPDSGIGLPAG